MTRRKRRPAYGDATTTHLAQAGVLKVDVTGHGRVTDRVRVPYSFGASVKYISLLSLLLLWLPTFGQMIAGYVGGRRAGSPWKAALAACVPVAAVYTILYASQYGYFTAEIAFLSSLPGIIAHSLSANIPILAPYIEFVSEYTVTFVAFLKATVTVGLDGYMVTIVFAYIGGVVARQRLREMDVLGAGARMRLVAPTALPAPVRAPSPWGAAQGQQLESMRKIRVVSKGAAVPQPVPKEVQAPPQPSPVAQAPPATEESASAKSAYDRQTLNRRLVERALRQYPRR